MNSLILGSLVGIVNLTKNLTATSIKNDTDRMQRMFIVMFNDIYVNYEKFHNTSLDDLFILIRKINCYRSDIATHLDYCRLVLNKNSNNIIYSKDALFYERLTVKCISYLAEIVMDEVIYQSKNYSNELNINCMNEQVDIVDCCNHFNDIKFGFTDMFDPNYYIDNKEFFTKINVWNMLIIKDYINRLNQTNGYININLTLRQSEFLTFLISRMVNKYDIDSIRNLLGETLLSVLDYRSNIGLSLLQLNDYINKKVGKIDSKINLSNLQHEQTILVECDQTLKFAVLVNNVGSSMYCSTKNYLDKVDDISKSSFCRFFGQALEYEEKTIKPNKTFNPIKVYKNLRKKKIPKYITNTIKIILTLYLGPINPEALFNLSQTIGDMVVNDDKDISDILNNIQKYSIELKSIVSTNSNKLDEIDRNVKMLMNK